LILKDIIYEDFCNFKHPSMFLIFPYCSFKCDTENGSCVCQNSSLVDRPNIDIDIDKIIDKYMSNNISKSIVCGGLEPLDSWEELKTFIVNLRYRTNDPLIIYTGYNKDEIKDQIAWLRFYENIIIKFGRFIPNQKTHYDKVLGIYLASDNQYAEVIS